MQSFKNRQYNRPVPRWNRYENHEGFTIGQQIKNNPKHGRKVYKAKHKDNNDLMILRLFSTKKEDVGWYELYYVKLANYCSNQSQFKQKEKKEQNYCYYLPMFYDMFKTAHNFYFFIQFVDGVTLEDKINLNKSHEVYMKQAEALKYIKQLCKFLKLVKKEGLAFDCIESKQVMIVFERQMKVVTQPIFEDRFFYKALKIRENEDEHSQYRAPEKYSCIAQNKPRTNINQGLGRQQIYLDKQVQNYNRKINEKGEIWSIGVILYQMLFNRTPFQGLNHYKAVNQQYLLCKSGKNKTNFNFQLIFPNNLVTKRTKQLIYSLLTFEPQERICLSDLRKWMKGVHKSGQFNQAYPDHYFNQISRKSRMKKQLQSEISAEERKLQQQERNKKLLQIEKQIQRKKQKQREISKQLQSRKEIERLKQEEMMKQIHIKIKREMEQERERERQKKLKKEVSLTQQKNLDRRQENSIKSNSTIEIFNTFPPFILQNLPVMGPPPPIMNSNAVKQNISQRQIIFKPPLIKTNQTQPNSTTSPYISNNPHYHLNQHACLNNKSSAYLFNPVNFPTNNSTSQKISFTYQQNGNSTGSLNSMPNDWVRKS